MGERIQAGLAFAAKDLLQLQRGSRAWVSFGIAIVSMATFAALNSSTRRELISLQLLYLSPALVVGNFFTRCIDAEVRVFVNLRMICRSTLAFLQAKLFVMIGFSLLVVWGITVVDSAIMLRGDGMAALAATLRQWGIVPLAVGISVYTDTAAASLKIADFVKTVFPETTVIVGGPHPAFCADEMLACPYSLKDPSWRNPRGPGGPSVVGKMNRAPGSGR